MALPSRASVDDWSSAIAEAAISQMNGSISIFDPSNMTTTPYDPETDTGGESIPSVILAARPARIQHLQNDQQGIGSGEVSNKVRYRFQIELRDGDPLITKGQYVRVLSGGRDSSLQHLTFQVVRAANSSHAAVRTIETTTDMVATS